VSIHQVRLESKQNQAIDEAKVVAYLKGEASLREALGIGDDVLAMLRRQAHALYDAAQWQRCVDVVRGLAELDDVQWTDAFLLVRCFEELGRPDLAAVCRDARDGMMSQIEDVLRGVKEARA
jgi:hypothetical protein